MKVEDCPYCQDNDVVVGHCGQKFEASEKTAYTCTRNKSHEGPHIACGFTEHECLAWNDNGVLVPTEEYEDG